MKPATPTPLPIGILALSVATLLAGCGGKDDHAGHDHGHGHKHEHRPPHGGTAVVLGREAFHLELVRTAETGLLTCYVLNSMPLQLPMRNRQGASLSSRSLVDGAFIAILTWRH